ADIQVVQNSAARGIDLGQVKFECTRRGLDLSERIEVPTVDDGCSRDPEWVDVATEKVAGARCPEVHRSPMERATRGIEGVQRVALCRDDDVVAVDQRLGVDRAVERQRVPGPAEAVEGGLAGVVAAASGVQVIRGPQRGHSGGARSAHEQRGDDKRKGPETRWHGLPLWRRARANGGCPRTATTPRSAEIRTMARCG